jgi:plasmid stabilization system protein ParE
VKGPYAVRIASSARRDYEQAVAWWEENRPKAPGAVREDVESALRRLERLGPVLGAKSMRGGHREWRRMTLPRIRYYLYFEVVEPSRTIEVMALWHISRGQHPRT